MEAQAMNYQVREMRMEDAPSLIRYFLNSDESFLRGMGVEPSKLPKEADWLKLLEEDFQRPLEERHFYYLLWEIDGTPVGHGNINCIEYGKTAIMHLHVWVPDLRKQGLGTQFLKASIQKFFDKFQLQELRCQPHQGNTAPNKTLPKVGFQFEKTYEPTPGWINYPHRVNLYSLQREDWESQYEQL